MSGLSTLLLRFARGARAHHAAVPQLVFASNCVFFCERSCVVLCSCLPSELETRSKLPPHLDPRRRKIPIYRIPTIPLWTNFQLPRSDACAWNSNALYFLVMSWHSLPHPSRSSASSLLRCRRYRCSLTQLEPELVLRSPRVACPG